jgi:hypothetical protein
LITPGLCLASKRPWKTQYKAGFLPAQAVLSRAGVQNYAAATNTDGRAGIVRRLPKETPNNAGVGDGSAVEA